MKKTTLTRNYENVNKGRFLGMGKYEIPIIRPQEIYEECNFIGFNYAASCKDRKNTGIHFYLDDYQFLRIWNRIDYYLPLLQQFKYVLTPDFSTYVDYPVALQIYNHYRKHWLGAYLQANGISVIPTISWSNENSYEWCFDGEPTRGVVSVSAVGTSMNYQSRTLFMNGYNEMLRRLLPEKIIFYGAVPDGCRGNILKIKAFQDKFAEVETDGR